MLAGLILVPNGEDMGHSMGDYYPSKDLPAANRTALREAGTPVNDAQYSHPWGVFFTILGTVLLDFDADACQSPARAYLLDVTVAGKQVSFWTHTTRTSRPLFFRRCGHLMTFGKEFHLAPRGLPPLAPSPRARPGPPWRRPPGLGVTFGTLIMLSVTRLNSLDSIHSPRAPFIPHGHRERSKFQALSQKGSRGVHSLAATEFANQKGPRRSLPLFEEAWRRSVGNKASSACAHPDSASCSWLRLVISPRRGAATQAKQARPVSEIERHPSTASTTRAMR